MSQVKIQGNASGTGTFTIAAPNSNTDRTLTLPDATGTVTVAPAGAVNFTAAPSGAMTVDASGNLGLGVTPSAWGASFKAVQVGATGALADNGGGDLYLLSNARFDGTNFRYLTSNFANYYTQENGVHQWHNAPSGTAGGTISFTQAMTLNASGNLGVGTTSLTGKLTVRNDSTSAPPFIDIVNRANSSTFDMGGIRFSAYRDVADPSYVAAIWANVDAPLGNLGNLYFGTRQNGDGALPTSRVIILSNGDFIVLGSYAQKASGTTWVNPSDVRLKENVRDYECGLDELMQVRVRRWEYNGKGGTVEGSAGLGVVADEIMSVLPDTVSVGGDIGDSDVPDLKKFDATEITWLLVKSVQEQQALIKEQQALITDLTARVAELEAN